MKEYDVYTDLDPDTLTNVAMETYRLWLQWALGEAQIGGKVLKHPSGRYAAALSWKRIGASHIAIIADETIAPEAQWLEEGKAQTDMKAAMLGKGHTRTSASGHRYRVIPIRKTSRPPRFDIASIVGSNAGERVPAGKAKMWARPRPHTNADHFATMSDKPGASDWMIPAMPAYSPAALLAQLLSQKVGH